MQYYSIAAKNRKYKLVSKTRDEIITRGTTLFADKISHFPYPTIRFPITGNSDIPYCKFGNIAQGWLNHKLRIASHHTATLWKPTKWLLSLSQPYSLIFVFYHYIFSLSTIFKNFFNIFYANFNMLHFYFIYCLFLLG